MSAGFTGSGKTHFGGNTRRPCNRAGLQPCRRPPQVFERSCTRRKPRPSYRPVTLSVVEGPAVAFRAVRIPAPSHRQHRHSPRSQQLPSPPGKILWQQIDEPCRHFGIYLASLTCRKSRRRLQGDSFRCAPLNAGMYLLRLHQRRNQRISALVSIFIRVVQYTHPGEACAHGQRQEYRHG